MAEDQGTQAALMGEQPRAMCPGHVTDEADHVLVSKLKCCFTVRFGNKTSGSNVFEVLL